MPRYVREFAAQFIIEVAVVSAVTAFAVVNKYWTWPNAVVGAVLLAAGLAYLMDRFDIGPSWRSRTREWLDTSGYAITTIQDQNTFHFSMTDNVNMVTDILQPKAGAPILVISAHHKATDAQLAAFNAMTPDNRAQFWKRVRRELLRQGVAYSNLILDGEGVAFSDSVMPGRTLTSTDFLHRVMVVRSTARLYLEFLMELALSAPSERVGSGPVGSAPSPSTH